MIHFYSRGGTKCYTKIALQGSTDPSMLPGRWKIV